ncbi:hypothetical protein NCCP2716_26170 [Sporosarcina sp. NCCP-2716]|uniref:GrpB family protein n=1 Tax=Sporosarcina sp. NCCP-2716 TaxID=2943679 RepID=UPI00203E78B1|nr:GrpB family protein [Sporosarcina sp. NCCP-2716]GKV70119.1 hypothetical protein NCCP2716_26170 [Sporosarcina sp. NCCP-2716]
MNLGLKKNQVRLADYTPEWSDEFLKVKRELLECTDLEEARIEHIGSTAITGMPAKPIIDIVVGVDNLENVAPALVKGFGEAGFLRLKVKRPGEIVFAKFTDDTYEEKTHFLHLVGYQKELWNNLLFFRDHLNAHEDARQQYLQVKLDYLRTSTTGITEYTNFKEAFVREIFARRESEDGN